MALASELQRTVRATSVNAYPNLFTRNTHERNPRLGLAQPIGQLECLRYCHRASLSILTVKINTSRAKQGNSMSAPRPIYSFALLATQI